MLGYCIPLLLKIYNFRNIVVYNIVSYRMRVGRKLWYGSQCYAYYKDYNCRLLIACKKCKFKKRKMYPQSKSKAATRLFSVIVYVSEKKCSESNPLSEIKKLIQQVLTGSAGAYCKFCKPKQEEFCH